MTERLFVVEWSDPQYPVIVDASFAPHITTEVTAMTFAECRTAIINHFEALTVHAKKMIEQTRRVTGSDIPRKGG